MNKIKKRGQITIFIILGVIIIVTIGIILYLQTESSEIDKESEALSEFNSRAEMFYDSTNDCFRELTKKAIIEIGNDSLLIGQYLKIYSLDCFDTESFSEADIKISLPVSIEITEKQELFDVNIILDTILTKGELTYQIKEYSFEIPKIEILNMRGGMIASPSLYAPPFFW
jgi:hypothetical protein